MAIYTFLEITNTVISVSKAAIRATFSRPIFYLGGNLQRKFMVVYGFFEIPKTVE